MSDAIRRELLGQIIAHPDDDGPRLVYADWLIERGDEERAQAMLEVRHPNLRKLTLPRDLSRVRPLTKRELQTRYKVTLVDGRP